jgi:hypothetical protein
MQIKRLAATGLRTHEIHKKHFPDFEPWEIHNAIHFDGTCESKDELIQAILRQNPDLAKLAQMRGISADSGLTGVIVFHEGEITAAKVLASEAHRKKSTPG